MKVFLRLILECTAVARMSYPARMTVRVNLREKDRSGGKSLVCPLPAVWPGNRSSHTGGGKRCPFSAQCLARGRADFPEQFLLSCTPCGTRQVKWKTSTVFHLTGKAIDKAAWNNNKSQLKLSFEKERKRNKPADLKHPRNLNRGCFTIQTHSILVCYFPSCCVNDPSVFAFTTLPDRPFHTFIILHVKKCFLTSVLNLF